MAVKMINAGSLPNIPWQEKPADLKTAAPVWRYTENPVMGRNPTPEIARIFNSAVVPWKDGFIAVLRGEQAAGRGQVRAAELLAKRYGLLSGVEPLNNREGMIVKIIDDRGG